MKEFKSPEETTEFLEKGIIGIAINIDSYYKKETKNTSFIIFKIKGIDSHNSRKYYYGDLVHASIHKFTKLMEIKLNIKQNDLVFWKDNNGMADIALIPCLPDGNGYKTRFCILEEKDNPEDIFQKMLNIGGTSESTFNSMELVIKNALSL